VDVACLAASALASGAAEPRECWARAVLRAAAEAAAGGRGARCHAHAVEIAVSLPHDKVRLLSLR
jgi:hypothetical protein